MLSVKLDKYSYRFAEQILNSNLSLKKELDDVILEASNDLSVLSRPEYNRLLRESFEKRNWISHPEVSDKETETFGHFDFIKNRIGVEVQFGHSHFIGNDLLEFQIASASNYDEIDVGVYIVATKDFMKKIQKEYGYKWDGSLSFERVIEYLPHVKNVIQVPIYVIGIDI